jgi:hypothetical protein
MDLKEVGWEDMDWFNLAKDSFQWRPVVKTVMKLWYPIKCGKFPNKLRNCWLLKKNLLHEFIPICTVWIL